MMVRAAKGFCLPSKITVKPRGLYRLAPIGSYLCHMLKEVLIKATFAGAAEMQRYFTRKDLQISNKEGKNNLVTEADHASDRAIIATIKEAFPDHFILTEETGELGAESAFKWIVDPIDGTINFAHGIPICAVSIGVEKDGEMLMGAVYNPFMNEFFFAERGQGAYLNDMQLRVSNETSLLTSCLVTGFPYTYLNETNGPLDIFDRLIRAGIPVRRLGSAALDLCWVACGRFDGFYEHKLNAWDSAAGFIIVEEAGGVVTDFAGNRFSPHQQRTVATNGHIHQQLLAVVQGQNLLNN